MYDHNNNSIEMYLKEHQKKQRSTVANQLKKKKETEVEADKDGWRRGITSY